MCVQTHSLAIRVLQCSASDVLKNIAEMDEDEPVTMSQVATKLIAPRRMPSGSKTFKDPIHGLLRFEPLAVAVIDTRQFQRLRGLNQLGLTHYVYPGATHTRFDHSLGVCHLANQFATNIYQTQRGQLDMDASDVVCVTLAGLCHDLGHGPFSHVFDQLLHRKGIMGWRHEEMSCMIFDDIVDQLPDKAEGSLSLSECDVKRIKHMIDIKKVSEEELQEKRFLYDIVNNNRNSIDVDKFDYLKRDAYYCGVPMAFDLQRVMSYNKVINNEICFKADEYENVFDVFQARQRMHRRVYTHPKVKSVEFMVVDALMEANEVFNFMGKIDDAAEFVKMDDTLLKMVEHCDSWLPMADLMNEDREEGRCIRKAQAIIGRLRERKLYKFVNEVRIPQGMQEQIKAKATAASLVSYYRGNNVALDPEDVIFSINRIDYTNKEKNPMDSVRFFDKSDEETPRTIKRSDVSHMMMEVFQEHSLRLHSRNADKRVLAALGEAFQGWQKEHLPGVNLLTPMKAKHGGSENGGPANREGPCSKRPRSLMGELDGAGAP